MKLPNTLPSWLLQRKLQTKRIKWHRILCSLLCTNRLRFWTTIFIMPSASSSQRKLLLGQMNLLRCHGFLKTAASTLGHCEACSPNRRATTASTASKSYSWIRGHARLYGSNLSCVRQQTPVHTEPSSGSTTQATWFLVRKPSCTWSLCRRIRIQFWTIVINSKEI